MQAAQQISSFDLTAAWNTVSRAKKRYEDNKCDYTRRVLDAAWRDYENIRKFINGEGDF